MATKALEHTGLATETARFQSYSAFTGTGFTTNEAEAIVNHPVRRRIAMILMILRNAGLVTAISTLVLSFVGAASAEEGLTRGGLLLAGLTRPGDPGAESVGGSLPLTRHRLGAAKVGRFSMEDDSWLVGKRLEECDLIGEGVIELGIVHDDGAYVGAPRGRYRLHVGDTFVMYGKSEKLDELEQRIGAPPARRPTRRRRRSTRGSCVSRTPRRCDTRQRKMIGDR